MNDGTRKELLMVCMYSDVVTGGFNYLHGIYVCAIDDFVGGVEKVAPFIRG